jgi:hypothetical protein
MVTVLLDDDRAVEAAAEPVVRSGVASAATAAALPRFRISRRVILLSR